MYVGLHTCERFCKKYLVTNFKKDFSKLFYTPILGLSPHFFFSLSVTYLILLLLRVFFFYCLFNLSHSLILYLGKHKTQGLLTSLMQFPLDVSGELLISAKSNHEPVLVLKPFQRQMSRILALLIFLSLLKIQTKICW